MARLILLAVVVVGFICLCQATDNQEHPDGHGGAHHDVHKIAKVATHRVHSEAHKGRTGEHDTHHVKRINPNVLKSLVG